MQQGQQHASDELSGDKALQKGYDSLPDKEKKQRQTKDCCLCFVSTRVSG